MLYEQNNMASIMCKGITKKNSARIANAAIATTITTNNDTCIKSS